MSVFVEIFTWLLVDTILGFLFYSTGCVVLKVVTFGQFKNDIKDFASFEVSKAKKVNLICLLGVCFYVALITLMAYLSH
ncbi:hypothetical protein B0W48_16485 [Pseudoalteromonas aliena]|uniref:Uncharacterized protein n=1 Tax=Pseudoalteromonas aliena TaxID=247523 RepID=A0A1Q2H1I5_9GAMM|nr:hypothetical protein [Pseudoalteromonas aliena]AQQ01228.1 hypothetical protein B0W48_16485 [Pseudoalteromonas aliena]